jgi:hypothetical protein
MEKLSLRIVNENEPIGSLADIPIIGVGLDLIVGRPNIRSAL